MRSRVLGLAAVLALGLLIPHPCEADPPKGLFGKALAAKHAEGVEARAGLADLVLWMATAAAQAEQDRMFKARREQLTRQFHETVTEAYINKHGSSRWVDENKQEARGWWMKNAPGPYGFLAFLDADSRKKAEELQESARKGERNAMLAAFRSKHPFKEFNDENLKDFNMGPHQASIYAEGVRVVNAEVRKRLFAILSGAKIDEAALKSRLANENEKKFHFDPGPKVDWDKEEREAEEALARERFEKRQRQWQNQPRGSYSDWAPGYE